MAISRRALLAGLSGVALSACSSRVLRQNTKPLRVLMLGGTNYVGYALVKAALTRGHRVTIFNRGRTNPHLFPEVEKLHGDRLDRADGLRALQGRNWDVAFDTWSAAPAVVGISAEALRTHVGQYVYISSIAVYGSYVRPGIDESAPAVRTTKIADPWSADTPYPIAKRRAEEHVEEELERHTILRASSINGFDPSRRPANQQVYWPIRIAQGGDVLSPGDGRDPLQYIDVADLAAFAVHAAERDLRGIFNVVGTPLAFAVYLDALRRLTGERARLRWIPTDFLLREGVLPFEHLPSWIPLTDPEPGFFQISNSRAVTHGLTFRRLTETCRDVYASYDVQALEPNVAGGLPGAREREVLEKWARQSETSSTGHS